MIKNGRRGTADVCFESGNIEDGAADLCFEIGNIEGVVADVYSQTAKRRSPDPLLKKFHMVLLCNVIRNVEI
jgi:hypothetical protein